MNVRIENPTLADALNVCVNALSELTENDNVYDDVNDTYISFKDLRSLLLENIE